MMKHWGTALLILSGLCAGALAQGNGYAQHPEPVPLHASRSATTPVPSFGFFGRAQCDAQSNSYFRIGKISEFNKTEILRLSAEGTNPKYYELSAEFSGSTAYQNYQVMPDGSLDVLVSANDHRDWYVFHWAADSSDSTHVHLNLPAGLMIVNFATLKNGNMIVSGIYGEHASRDLKGKAYSAYLSAGGEVRRELPSDLEENTTGELKAYDAAFSLGEDGSLYFVEQDSVKVISESGKVIRVLRPPKPTDRAMLASIAESKRSLAVWFRELPPKQDAGRFKLWLEVIDPISGDVRRLYEPDPDLYNNALCFTGNSFVFYARTDNGFLRLITADIE